MSMWASTATNVPSASWASGLISASVMSYFTNSFASFERIGVSRLSSEPVIPIEAIASFALKSMCGRIVEKWPRPMWSGCSSATSSMSIPPMSEKTNVGQLPHAVVDHAGVVLLLDLGLGADQHALRHVAVDLEGEDLAGVRLGLLGRVGELHAAGLHAPAGEHLRLDHHRAADLRRDRLGLLGVRREAAVGHGNALALEDLPRFVLEEAH